MQSNDTKIDELFDDIERPRNVEELDAYYQEIMNLISGDLELIKFARVRKGLFKEFFNEFIPLYKFVKSEYSDKGCRYNIVIGNQNYDAIIQGAGVYRKVEISKYHDGHLRNKSMKELNANRVSKAIVGDVDKAIEKYINNFLDCVREKKRKNYINTDIIFVIDSGETSPYIFEFNKDSLIEKIVQEIGKIFDGSTGVSLLIEKQGDTFSEDIVIKIC